MTLIELLVAMGVLAMLGLALTLVLRQSIRLWNLGESRREAYEEAERIFRAVRSDLSSTFTRSAFDGEVRAIMLCYPSGAQRQKLTFVRTISAEPSDRVARATGLALGSAYLDARDDSEEAQRRELLATGGLQEVMYAHDPRGGDGLYRAYRSPIGGDRSLFVRKIPDDSLDTWCQLLSDRVLLCRWQFWSEASRSWNGDRPALDVWDSTRSAAAFRNASGPFSLFRGVKSLADPGDDVFPMKVRLTLILKEGTQSIESFLDGAVSERDTRLRLVAEEPFPPSGGYAQLGTEWVKFEGASGVILRIERDGRGALGTVPAAHPAGTRVRTGRTFIQTFSIPAFREDWRRNG